MTFVSGYRMIFNLFKLEQIHNEILCNTMVLSSKIIIVSKKDRLWARNATITDCRQTRHGTVRKGRKVGIVQALIVQYRYLSCSFSFQCEQICSDQTKILLGYWPSPISFLAVNSMYS